MPRQPKAKDGSKAGAAGRSLPGLAPWVGGKRVLAGRLVARIEAIPHQLFAEPFVGMGGVFFRRKVRAAAEAINDANGEVVNLFRVVRHHAGALLDELQFGLHSRAEFDRLRALDPTTLTDIQRAARFYQLQRWAYGGRVRSPTFQTGRHRPRALSREALQRHITLAHQRLAKVTVEGLDFGDFIGRYDRKAALFYVDPPYWNCEGYYGAGLFERADFERLAEALRRLKGRFIMSMNDVPEIREMFAWATIEEEPVTYRMGGVKRVVELVISR